MLVAFSTLLILASCSKEHTSPEELITPTKATIDYMGDPALDGYGWVIRVDNDFEIPDNLSNEFKVDEMEINVVYKKTDKLYPCRCTNPKYMVNIVTISKR